VTPATEVETGKKLKVVDVPAPAAGDFEQLTAMELVRGSRSVARVALFLAIVFVVFTIALLLVPWTQNVSGHGRVIAFTPYERQQAVAAPVEGRVVRWHVVEGSQVQTGDPLVEISDNDPEILSRLRSEREATQSRLEAARQREMSLTDRIRYLEESKRNALAAIDARIQVVDERIRAEHQNIKAAEATLVTAQLQIARQKELNKRGLAATRAVEVAQMEEERAEAALEATRAALSAAARDREALLAEQRRTETDLDASIRDASASRAGASGEVAATAAALQPIGTRIARQSTQQVRAPRSGTVLRLLAQPGSELLKAGDPLLILVPDSNDTVVELWVKGNDMPLIFPGRSVRLQFEGWPAIQFVGWPSVAVGTFGGVVKMLDATDDGAGRFRVLVEPDPNGEPWPSKRFLRQGVRANGWFLLNVVPLGYELWRQFNGFPPVAAMREPELFEVGRDK
jgi:membrane fusion protein, adhesin transport system